MSSLRDLNVLKFSILSRLAVVLLSLLSSSLVPTYDVSFDVRPTPNQAASLFESLARWDGVYFVRLAQTNLIYEFEQFHAFFPLLPTLLHYCTQWTTVFLSSSPPPTEITSTSPLLVLPAPPRSHYILTGVIITNLAFVLAALVLYRLGLAIYGPHQEAKAYTGALLFCVSPASIFFSAIYTESVFALFSFGFMLCYVQMIRVIRGNRADSSSSSSGAMVELLPWWGGCTTCGVLATFTRSNGVVLAAYPLHFVLLSLGSRS